LFFLFTILSSSLVAEATIEGQVCTDTSYYGDVEYLDTDSSCCVTNLAEPECTTTKEKACINVTETVCMASITQECQTVNCPVSLVKVNNVQKTFISKKCSSNPKQISHTKVRQVPKTVTKKLCNTLWKINADGEKVWAGEDQCRDVEWNIFEEEEYEAILETTETVCVDDNEIPFSTCQEEAYVNQQICYECKAVAKPLCEPVLVEMCDTIDVTNCIPKVAKPECGNSPAKVPSQEYFHQEKCLFDNSGLLAGNDVARDDDQHDHHRHAHHGHN